MNLYKNRLCVFFLTLVLVLVSSFNSISNAQSPQISNQKQLNRQDIIKVEENKKGEKELQPEKNNHRDENENDQKEEKSTQKEHDWWFYIINVIVTTSLTCFLNWLNSQIKVKELKIGAHVDRHKAILIAGLEIEKTIYSKMIDIKQDISCGNTDKVAEKVEILSNYTVENRINIRDSLYTIINDFTTYATGYANGDGRDQQKEQNFITKYINDYRA